MSDTRSSAEDLAPLLDAIDQLRASTDADLLFRKAVELARDRLGLRRVGIFLIDETLALRRGVWSMDLSATIVDERDVLCDLDSTDREALRRARVLGLAFSVFEGGPILEHRRSETRTAGRGWVAKTPIRSSKGTVAMMFNDAALTDESVDPVRQAHAAILCATLGVMLDPSRGVLLRRTVGGSPGQRLVESAIALLEERPALGGRELSKALDVTLPRLAFVFKATIGVSLTEYRNRLRLARFEALARPGDLNLLEAALGAGFGSYAQFHRVFRAHRHMTPRAYVGPSRSVDELLRHGRGRQTASQRRAR